MVYTCSYENFKTSLFKGVSISGDKGKKVGFNKYYFSLLAPKKSFWEVWHNNIGKISTEENNEYYIREYYNQVLSNLDPQTIYDKLCNSFLLCYEESNDFCHRHIVSAWFELFLNVEVEEVKVENLYIEKININNNIKSTLEQIIKEKVNMRGFNSLRALYLFNEGEELENLANEKEKTHNKSYDSLRQAACYMRCEADMEEEKYNTNLKTKKLIHNE